MRELQYMSPKIHERNTDMSPKIHEGNTFKCLQKSMRKIQKCLQKSMREIHNMSPKIRGTEMYSHGFLEILCPDIIIVSRIFGDI